MRKILIILLASTFFGISSQNVEELLWKNVEEKRNTESLISYAFEFPENDKVSLCISALDSLINLTPAISLSLWTCYDTAETKIWFTFGNTSHDYGDYVGPGRRAFPLTICDTVVYHKSLLISNEKIVESLRDILLNPKTNKMPYKVIRRYIENQGELETKDIWPVIDTDIVVNDNEYFEINWPKYFEIMHVVKSTYKQIWHEKALEFWNIDFDLLNIKDQLEIMDAYPLNFELNFIRTKHSKK